jgi:hypothetical protein
MIRPRRFVGNAQTLASNRFQDPAVPQTGIGRAAQREFDGFAARLDRCGVRVHAFAGHAELDCPDEVFPNNWLSLHADGTVVIYPMLAPNRRSERRPELLDELRRHGYRIERVLDLSRLEEQGRFLEGTGSLVLDRAQRIAYGCLSPRTHGDALAELGRRLCYEVVAFEAADRGGFPIYHTNVLMSVGTGFAVICAAAIRDRAQRRHVLDTLRSSGRGVLEIDIEQMHAFAGNLLELRSTCGPIIVLSATALAALDESQAGALRSHGALVTADIPTIERYGGGSVRCMLAEVHLPRA